MGLIGWGNICNKNLCVSPINAAGKKGREMSTHNKDLYIHIFKM